MKLTTNITTLILSALLLATAAAQTTAARQSSPSKAQEQIALELLEKVIAETPSLALEENRFKLWLGAAQLLWERDEKRARTLITHAMTEYAGLVAGLQEDWKAKKDYDEILDRTSPSDLRKELGLVLADLDPRLAWEFFTSTQTAPGKYEEFVQRYGDPEQELEMTLIRQAVLKDSAFVLEKAERHLTKYGFQNFTTAVRELVTRDKATAVALTKAMVASYKKLPNPFEFEKLGIIENLLRAALGAEAYVLGAPWRPGFSINDKTPRLDDPTVREVLEAMGAAALEVTKKNSQQFTTDDLFSSPAAFQQIEKYVPTLAQQIKKQTQLNLKNAPLSVQQAVAARQTMPEVNETVEALLTRAKTAPASEAKSLYQRAAQTAYQQGALQRARQIVEEHIKEEDRSFDMDSLLAKVEEAELAESVKKVDVATAQRLANNQYSLQERIKSLTALAENLARAGEQKKAAEILQNLRQQLGTQITTQSQLESQFRLAGAYAQVDPSQGVAVLELTVSRLNDLVGAMATLQGIQKDAMFRNGEMTIYRNTSIVGKLLHQQIAVLTTLAKADAQRVSSLLEMYQRNEIKTWARLSICQELLGK